MQINYVQLFVNNGSTEIRVEIPIRKMRITEGNDFTLHCKTTKDWHSCTWGRYSNEETCQFKYMKLGAIERWKPRKTNCGSSYRTPKFNRRNEKTWINQCGENNRECTITISGAQIADAGEWYCEVEPCESIEGIGCCAMNAGERKRANVTVQVRCLNTEYLGVS